MEFIILRFLTKSSGVSGVEIYGKQEHMSDNANMKELIFKLDKLIK